MKAGSPSLLNKDRELWVAKFEAEIFIWGYPPFPNKNFAFGLVKGSKVCGLRQK
jgi:hypothetical protein